MGFAPTDHGLGMIARVSQKQVVNVAQRGGLAAMLVGYSPENLRARRAPGFRARSRHRSYAPPFGGCATSTTSIQLLEWDEETYRPRDAAEDRASQLGRARRVAARPARGRSRSATCWRRSRRVPTLTVRERVELDRLGRLRRAAVALPQSLVAAFAETRSHCLAAWEEARRARGLRAVSRAVRAGPEADARARRGAAACRTIFPTRCSTSSEPGMRRARLEPLLQAMGARLRAVVPALAERTRR